MKNILGREIPEYIEGYGKVTLLKGHLNMLELKQEKK